MDRSKTVMGSTNYGGKGYDILDDGEQYRSTIKGFGATSFQVLRLDRSNSI